MVEIKRLAITLTSEMHEALSELAKERGQSMGYITREALAAYLERSLKRVEKVHPNKKGGRRPGAGRPPKDES